MTSKTKTEIKAFFETGDAPTESQFIDFIDSYVDKSGPVGTLETMASAGTNGIVFASGGDIEIYNAANSRAFMGINVYTTAQVLSISEQNFTTTAAASSAASDAITARIGTTAQATAGTSPSLLMTPITTLKMIESFAPKRQRIAKQNTTSGTSYDFNIESWSEENEFYFVGVSTNGTSDLVLQIADAGGFETSNYLGSESKISSIVSTNNHGNYIVLSDAAATSMRHGYVRISLADEATWTYVVYGGFGLSNSALNYIYLGSIELDSPLTTVRFKTENGVDVFDAGFISGVMHGTDN